MIAIDPSLNSTGIAFRHGGGVKTATLKVKKMRGPERLMWIRKSVEHFLDQYPTDTVIYENYSFGSKGRSTFDIGELGGVLKTLCYESGVRVLLVPPATLKLFTAGTGTADKDAMAVAVEERWNRTFDNSDEADAFALLMLGEVFFNPRRRRAMTSKVKQSLLKCEILQAA